jgi:hypothetical protein
MITPPLFIFVANFTHSMKSKKVRRRIYYERSLRNGIPNKVMNGAEGWIQVGVDSLCIFVYIIMK